MSMVDYWTRLDNVILTVHYGYIIIIVLLPVTYVMCETEKTDSQSHMLSKSTYYAPMYNFNQFYACQRRQLLGANNNK